MLSLKKSCTLFAGSKRIDKQIENFIITSPLPGLSTRHYSLSAIDDNSRNACPSPVPYFFPESLHPMMQGPPNFAIGETVSSSSFNGNVYHRERCFSLGDPTVSPPSGPPPPLLSPQTRASLGIGT